MMIFLAFSWLDAKILPHGSKGTRLTVVVYPCCIHCKWWAEDDGRHVRAGKAVCKELLRVPGCAGRCFPCTVMRRDASGGRGQGGISCGGRVSISMIYGSCRPIEEARVARHGLADACQVGPAKACLLTSLPCSTCLHR